MSQNEFKGGGRLQALSPMQKHTVLYSMNVGSLVGV